MLPSSSSGSPSREVIILIVEDDVGHARLIQRHLQRAGLRNPMLRFAGGQQILDFLFGRGDDPGWSAESAYFMLLDIRMGLVDGTEVLRQVKADPARCGIAISMLTTTDDPREMQCCRELGCENYIVKPLDYDKFANAIRELGLFVSLLQAPAQGWGKPMQSGG
jgi:CheY-like chemotaxis protein